MDGMAEMMYDINYQYEPRDLSVKCMMKFFGVVMQSLVQSVVNILHNPILGQRVRIL